MLFCRLFQPYKSGRRSRYATSPCLLYRLACVDSLRTPSAFQSSTCHRTYLTHDSSAGRRQHNRGETNHPWLRHAMTSTGEDTESSSHIWPCLIADEILGEMMSIKDPHETTGRDPLPTPSKALDNDDTEGKSGMFGRDHSQPIRTISIIIFVGKPS